MNPNIVSAVFDNRADAERAVSELRRVGVSDAAISIVAQQDGKHTETDGSGAEETTDFVGKVAAGAGIGTLLGIAALAIPGVGPLVAAGAIASSAIPGAAITGAAIGGAAGGLTKVLGDHGVGHEDAAYYEDRVNNGGVFVSVDNSDGTTSAETIRDVLDNAGGHNSTRPRTATAAL
ncbi:hypothetical protein [Sphingomonas asaccharolytica]|uniref:hypothetical protein n=1 Tax=Sphingomonas asaccharolytica TaxID=40681 RepID=UPI000830B881|nr:hypothetical protein [Sphingomonas asaccharolytica]